MRLRSERMSRHCLATAIVHRMSLRAGHCVAQTAAPSLTRQQRELLSHHHRRRCGRGPARDRRSEVAASHHARVGRIALRRVLGRAAGDAAACRARSCSICGSRRPRRPALTRIAERSPIREWLAGSRTDPRLLPKSGIAIGEMPIDGRRRQSTRAASTTSTGSQRAALIELERERARQEKEERDKQRRNELEGKEASSRDIVPFEDFDLASNQPAAMARASSRARSPPVPATTICSWRGRIRRQPSRQRQCASSVSRSTLEPARTIGLITSSVILADSVSVRPAPYSPAEQASHPYSIGLMEIVPARSARYGRDEQSVGRVPGHQRAVERRRQAGSRRQLPDRPAQRRT